MKSEVKLCQIKDSKSSKNRFLFYPNKSCLTPYNTTINKLNYNIIKQKRENEQKNKNKIILKIKSDIIKKSSDNLNITSDNLNKKNEKLGTYYFNYNSIIDPDIMENNFSKKYKNIYNNNMNNDNSNKENTNLINLDNINNSEKENEMIEKPLNEDYINNKILSKDNCILIKENIPEKDIDNNANNLSYNANKEIHFNNNTKKQENNLLKNKKDFFPKGVGGAKVPNKKI